MNSLVARSHLKTITAAADGQDLRAVMRGLVDTVAGARELIPPQWGDDIVAVRTGLDRLDDDIKWWTCVELGEVYQRLLGKERRTAGGVFYTPAPVAWNMVRLAVDAWRGVSIDTSRLAIIDPACGAGVFLASAVGQLATMEARRDGPDASNWDIMLRIPEVAQRAVFGIDIDPIAVDLAKAAIWLDSGGRMPITWLDDNIICGDPLNEDVPPAWEKRLADASTVPMVVGNPPYGDAKDVAPWIEKSGQDELIPRPNLDAFRAEGMGRYEYKLRNWYVYFWRWAAWVALERRPGVLSLLTPSSYFDGKAYTGMREYLRRWADDGWVIDLSPEGHQAPIKTRIFREIATPVAIGMFIRRGAEPDLETSARIRYLEIDGEQSTPAEAGDAA